MRRRRSCFPSRPRSRTPTSPPRSSSCAIGGGAVPIPPGGAVLLAKGAAATALSAEAPVTQLVTLRLLFKPDWPNVVAAIGGGPQIVRNGAAVFKAGELFTTSQLGPRVPRSAIGQLADGRIVLVAVDGGQPGYSVGMTNFELAQALVRLGAVTGMAFDSGGSTTMAFDGSPPQQAVRARAPDRDGARVPVRRRLRTAGDRGRLAGRRRRRRQADAPVQARPRVDRDRPADGAGRDDRVRGDGDEAARQLRGRIPAEGLAAARRAAAADHHADRRRRRPRRRRPRPTTTTPATTTTTPTKTTPTPSTPTRSTQAAGPRRRASGS